jgi:holo-[acyl-carrier protein] synthase
MLHCGIDLVEVARVRAAIEKNGEHFLRRVFTAREVAYCLDMLHPWPHWAVRFAAKEAFYKAVPPGTLPALVWSEVGVAHSPNGGPHLEFMGETDVRLAGWKFTISLSHTRELAIAQVLAKPPRANAG